MALTAGSRIGTYEIISAIGAGGMGEVYRARDAKLARDVALKVLPAEFALDPDRLARFTREAQVLASLNHQNIAAIYGFEENALVLEFVDGPTLADRITQGRIPLDEALPIARQIAEALEVAHEQGIVHRDLKPANIKVRPDGTVKVLDFGLAKLAATGVTHAGSIKQDPAYTVSPTITTPAMTQVGMILGTAAYMSPEQAKGREADKRSDIWAFGCVLFEMLTGKRVFEGDDVSDTLAAVLRAEPAWGTLPPSAPRAIRTLLRRCLERDRKRRLADAADARLEIEEALASPHDEAVATVSSTFVRRPRWRSALIAATVLIVGGAIAVLAMWNRQPPERPLAITRFAIALGEGQRFFESGTRPLAISADGTRLVYVANRRIYLRSMDAFEAKPIPGTEIGVGQISSPVFSPDGQSIAFVGGRPASIRRIAVTGGAALTICEGCAALGGMNWSDQGIVFAQAGRGQGFPVPFAGERSAEGTARIMRVAADGGEPQLLFNVTDGIPWDAQLLPGGKAVLFEFIASRDLLQAFNENAGQVVVQSLTGQRKVVIANASEPRYFNTGHIVYARQGVLFARHFDLERLEATGEEVPVVEGVRRPSFVGGGTTRASYYDVSSTGSLVYVPGPTTIAPQYDLGLLNPRTGVDALKLTPNAYEYPQVSRDGKWIAVGTNDERTANVWIYERSGVSSIRQLTFVGKNRYPIWCPDNVSVTFQSDRGGALGLWRQRADGGVRPEELTKPAPGETHVPDAWSPDGRTLLFEIDKDSQRTLWALSLPDKKISRVGDIQATYPLDATFSPNGRWIAYRSAIDRASGVSVEPFPFTGASRVPLENGLHPVWGHDGKTLFFRRLTTGEFMALPVTTTNPTFTFGKPEELAMTFPDRTSNAGRRSFDITPEGTFVGIIAAGQNDFITTPQIKVVLNWFEELKQKAH